MRTLVNTQHQQTPPEAALPVVAAIDVGSSAIRMEIAEIHPSGDFEIIDSLRRGVLLGNDAFTTGVLSRESIQVACDVLRDFRDAMDGYGIEQYRAVATSAVREANNADAFIDRVLMSTGIEIEVIEGVEENRLTYSAARVALDGRVDLNAHDAMLVEIGGGSSDLTFLEAGRIAYSETCGLGSIRLRQLVRGLTTTHIQRTELYRRHIRNAVSMLRRSMPLERAELFVALGGDMRFASRSLIGPEPSDGLWTLPRNDFLEFCEKVARLDRDQLVEEFPIDYTDAQTLVPALLSYQQLLMETPAQEVTVPRVSIRRGMLLEMATAHSEEGQLSLAEETKSSAITIARRYEVDENHARHVAYLATLLFDQLTSLHGLNRRHRLLLETAALLHEIGTFVSPSAHHKHTQYLIAKSPIFGLRREEVEIVSNVARYHRRSPPKRTHPDFMALDRTARAVVCKLAAILRIADALEKEHRQKLKGLSTEITRERVTIFVDPEQDWTMERMAVSSKDDLFQDIFGKQVVVRSLQMNQ